MSSIRVVGDVAGLRDQVTKCQNRSTHDGTVDPEVWGRARALLRAAEGLVVSIARSAEEPALEELPCLADLLRDKRIGLPEAARSIAESVGETLEGVRPLERITGHGPVWLSRGSSREACFTLYNTGKAVTGGKDGGLRADVAEILRGHGFDAK